MKAEDKISKAKVFLVTQRPFWASCMMGLNVTETNDIPTMATDGNTIFWNRTFVDAKIRPNPHAVIIKARIEIGSIQRFAVGARPK